MGLFSAISKAMQAAQEKAESEAAPLIQLIEERDLSGGADALCRRLGSLSFTARGVAMQAYRRKIRFSNTKYFDKQNIRLKAEDVGEKNLYGLYYDYDSSFEHGLWGAIRESSLLKCNNPAHKYHCVPDVEDETRLKTVLPDCIMIMNKTISFLDEIYGIPEQLLNEVIDFEIKPIAG